MGWTIVVSKDETFVRGAVERLRDGTDVVGATGVSAARSLLACLEVEAVIADAADEVGRAILAALKLTRNAGVGRVVAVDGARNGFPELHAPDLSHAVHSVRASAA